MIYDPLTVLPTVGKKRFVQLNNSLGISTVLDLLYYIPFKYIDQSSFVKISECVEDEIQTFHGTITKISVSNFKRKFLDITLSDETGIIHLLFFGGIQFYKNQFIEGMQVTASGKVQKRRSLQIVHPEIETSDTDNIHTGRIVPVYSIPMSLRNHSISTRYLRKIVYSALDYIKNIHEDSLLSEYYKKNNLLTFYQSLFNIHFPDTFNMQKKARERLAYDELLHMQIAVLKHKAMRIEHESLMKNTAQMLFDKFQKNLPFTLTDDQQETCRDIESDLTLAYPMNRLLQGDVGSGKTVVAAYAVFITHSNKFQSAVMAPTEILARQHFKTFQQLLPEISIRLLTGKTSTADRKEILDGIKNGTISTIIGTHALIESDVQFKNLSLVVIDEQHRFGLNQRLKLRKKDTSVHLLSMSATPIPRTMAITLYGDMDISRITQKPHGRMDIKTLVLDVTQRSGVFNSMEKYIRQGQQCYYVVPMIDESDELELESIEKAYQEIKDRFGFCEVSMIHGRMKSREKDDVMEQFKNNEVSLLVSTTVIEVGIDVPNATVIVIRHPERFGLAQLHQLRGRVGRGSEQSFLCFVT
jgi:ATP-dependent DNA helicase RecG